MKNVIYDKSFAFAVKIVLLARQIRDSKKEYELASQFLKSGTSIGANVSEAQKAQSKKDFISKMYIAAKEASETLYWLRLLDATDIIDNKTFKDIYKDAYEIDRILTSIIKTSQKNQNRGNSKDE